MLRDATVEERRLADMQCDKRKLPLRTGQGNTEQKCFMQLWHAESATVSSRTERDEFERTHIG